MTDGRALEIAKQLKAKLPYSIVVIMPEKYNELYERIRNLNKLLAWGHARAIENLLEKVECGQVISDKFADVRVLEKALMRKGRSVHLIQQVRGESEMPVAAASVLARAEFLESVLRMGRKWKTTFPKGASALVDEAGRKFVETWGENDLDSVAKIHFKNTRKIRELLTRLL